MKALLAAALLALPAGRAAAVELSELTSQLALVNGPDAGPTLDAIATQIGAERAALWGRQPAPIQEAGAAAFGAYVDREILRTQQAARLAADFAALRATTDEQCRASVSACEAGIAAYCAQLAAASAADAGNGVLSAAALEAIRHSRSRVRNELCAGLQRVASNRRQRAQRLAVMGGDLGGGSAASAIGTAAAPMALVGGPSGSPSAHGSVLDARDVYAAALPTAKPAAHGGAGGGLPPAYGSVLDARDAAAFALPSALPSLSQRLSSQSLHMAAPPAAPRSPAEQAAREAGYRVRAKVLNFTRSPGMARSAELTTRVVYSNIPWDLLRAVQAAAHLGSATPLPSSSGAGTPPQPPTPPAASDPYGGLNCMRRVPYSRVEDLRAVLRADGYARACIRGDRIRERGDCVEFDCIVGASANAVMDVVAGLAARGSRRILVDLDATGIEYADSGDPEVETYYERIHEAWDRVPADARPGLDVIFMASHGAQWGGLRTYALDGGLFEEE